jgi:hypothetical protein
MNFPPIDLDLSLTQEFNKTVLCKELENLEFNRKNFEELKNIINHLNIQVMVKDNVIVKLLKS